MLGFLEKGVPELLQYSGATSTRHTPATPPRVSFLSGVGGYDNSNMKTQSSFTMVLHQLNPFEVGQVKAHVEHGLSAAAIAERVLKADGKTKFGETAIQNCINKLYANPGWRGEREKGTGPVRKTTPKQDNGFRKSEASRRFQYLQ